MTDKNDLADEIYEDDRKPLSHDVDKDGKRSHYSNTNKYSGDGKKKDHEDDGHAARHRNTRRRKGKIPDDDDFGLGY